MSARHKLFQAGAVLALLLILVRGASAQGLGGITLESSLNEPLRATIELLNVGGLNESQIEISVASLADYEQAGLERSLLISRIDFDVELFPLGRGQVTLTTEERVEEPFLNLLISARWPSGRVLREYTLLLDLPTFSQNGASQPAVSAPVTAASGSGQAAAPEPASGGAAQADTYTVAGGDTIWEIAEQTRPDIGVTVQQMMIAIQRANEDAFVNNNVNRLLNGRVLRIPTRQEIDIVTHEAAVAQIEAQNRQLGLMRFDSTGNVAGGAEPRQQDELSIVTEDDAAPGSSDLEATIAALENELMLAEEELDRVRLENQELSSQLGDLEEQIDILKNIIAIEDERIAQLQQELAEQAEAAEQAIAEASRVEQNLAAVEQQSPAAGNIVDRILGMLETYMLEIGAGVGLLVLVLGFLVYRNRRAAMDEEDDFAFAEVERDGPRGATPLEAEEEEGFIARLLGRFRKDEDEEDEDFDDEDEDPARDDNESEAGVAFSADAEEDDEEDLTGMAYADTDDAGEMDDEDEDDAEVLASSVMDEVGDSLESADTEGYDQIAAFGESDETAEDDERFAADDLSAALDAIEDEQDEAAQDDAREVEFDLSEETDTGESATAQTEEEQPEEQTEETETFEFSLKQEPEPAALADEPADEPAEDVETFDFALKEASPEPAPEAEEPAVEDSEIEKFEFSVDDSPAAAPVSAPDPEVGKDDDNGLSLDLGNLTFDEEDVKAEAELQDEEESDYAPRTDMDECDTKLDLAVAYEAMGDIDGAVEILDEVIAEGKPAQVEEANRLKAKWQGT